MHVTPTMASLMSDMIRTRYDYRTKTAIEYPENPALDEACINYLKSRSDYQDFKLSVFKYLSKAQFNFRKTPEFKQLYPELFL